MITLTSLPVTVSDYLEAQPVEAHPAIVQALLALAVDVLRTGEVEGQDGGSGPDGECRPYSVYPDWWGERPSSRGKEKKIRWVCTDPTQGPWAYPPRKVDRSTQTTLSPITPMAQSPSPPHPPLPPAIYFTIPSRAEDGAKKKEQGVQPPTKKPDKADTARDDPPSQRHSLPTVKITSGTSPTPSIGLTPRNEPHSINQDFSIHI
ncbi:hypothetical protein BJ684DRAFT_16757 [Piptocephalis cylindrospora]|uniref:Uncharacterized protein n=1 Tax=Piptocephalis cylindrospora TaxID=1907219 RepID=A0A4P9Y2I8_9FUNG|nr:hypothetical protein BJ684DRAFT_16757 [Piptocephalis cylindrospora]|eukprot:RKP12792.1 hypothetical protein BJ684DRAFT_16757 [Piptocephalis cylindrospora]